jgi:hypothetical protein
METRSASDVAQLPRNAGNTSSKSILAKEKNQGGNDPTIWFSPT